MKVIKNTKLYILQRKMKSQNLVFFFFLTFRNYVKQENEEMNKKKKKDFVMKTIC